MLSSSVIKLQKWLRILDRMLEVSTVLSALHDRVREENGELNRNFTLHSEFRERIKKLFDWKIKLLHIFSLSAKDSLRNISR